MSKSTSKDTNPVKVDSGTVNTETEGVVDVGDQAWVSPVMEAALAGEAVTIDTSIGGLDPEADDLSEVE